MKYLNKFDSFVENINQIPISNFESYIDGISKSIADKLFFIDKVKFDCLVDFGCANGKVLSEIKKILPNVRLIGYDIDQEMISKAKENEGILFTSNWNEVISEIKKYKTPIINLSSVIHEVYSYSHGLLVKKFWESQVFSDKFKYIIIRDMIPSTEMGKSESFKSDVKKIRQKSNKFYLDSFEKKWGKISDNYKVLTHYLLKYKFTDNWEREVNENYLPISLETLKKKIPHNYSIIYEDSFILPYLRDQVMKDFGIELAHTTHTKMILKNNIREIKEANSDTFKSSEQYSELCKKYAIDKNSIKEYFTDITDDFNTVFISNVYLTHNDINIFNINFNIRFLISYPAIQDDSDKILNINEYTKMLEKQLLDIKIINGNCERFSKMEGFDMNITKTHIPYAGLTSLKRSSELCIEYRCTKTVSSNDMAIAKRNYLDSITSEEKDINDCLQKIETKLIDEGITKVERLIDIHPGHEEMNIVIFGFLTNSEIITVAEYNKRNKTLQFDRNGIANAVQAYLDGECDEYLV